MSRRLAIVTTHPVQYYAPLYRVLANTPGLDVEVFFAHRPTPAEQGTGFGVSFRWDTDLTGGYSHRFLVNRAPRPDVERFNGCDTPEIASIIERGRFDGVLIMGWHTRSLWQAMRAAWRGGTPLFVRGDSQLLNDPVLKRAVKRAVYPLFVRRFAACLSVGTRSAAYFEHYGARRIVHSPHFVDNAAFGAAADRARSDRSATRGQWGIPERSFVVLFAGKFIEKKRPLDVVRAVAATGRDDVHLLLAGDGTLRSAIEDEARALGVGTHFAGFLNQSLIPRAYAAADVLALPSDARETWGLVVNEAMASQLPAVVSFDAGCAPDLILESRTGHVIPMGDVKQLGARMGSLAANPGQARAMGSAARQHVAAFSVDAAAAGVIEALYDSSLRVAA